MQACTGRPWKNWTCTSLAQDICGVDNSLVATCFIRYLPSYPYQDNPVLHVYAGLIALYLAQPASDISSETTYGPFTLHCQFISLNSSFCFLASLLTPRSGTSCDKRHHAALNESCSSHVTMEMQLVFQLRGFDLISLTALRAAMAETGLLAHRKWYTRGSL